MTQNAFVKQVLHANANAVDFVGIGRADSATGGADRALAQESLRNFVDGHVIRRDDVRVRRNAKLAGVDATSLKRLNLVKQNRQVNDHAV